MNYFEFHKQLNRFPVFGLKDIEKMFPSFDNRRLVEWQGKGYIHKIKRGFYCFTEVERDEPFLFFASNKIYAPSYVSLESALDFYTVIPEGVFTVTSISTKNTTIIHSEIAKFQYKHIKRNLFFGYKIQQNAKFATKIAELEKAVLDYLYFATTMKSVQDIEALRWNKEILRGIEFEKLAKYQQLFNSKTMDKRVKFLMKYIYA